MATLTTTQFGTTASYCPQAQLVVTISSETATTAVLSWTMKWVTHGYTVTSSASKAWSIKINGSTPSGGSGSFAIGGKSSQNIASGTVTINKTTASQSIALYMQMDMSFTWGTASGGTRSKSGSITIGAKTSYSVTYDANGGSGAPSAQTKWHGTNLTLSSKKPTRDGHTFNGWATSSGGSVAYASGATYSSNESVTLYAIWTKITYSVTYNANGGSGAPSAQTKSWGDALTLSSTKPTRTNYTFKGWATSSTGGVAYASGASYTGNAALTLYAVWELAYEPPTISGMKVQRCNSGGTLTEEGTYAKVTFAWSCSQLLGANNVKSPITVLCNGTTTNVTASGTSGNVSVVVGSGGLSIDKTYDIKATVTDSKSGASASTVQLSSAKFPLDLSQTGVSLGGGVARDGWVDSQQNHRFFKNIYDSYNTRITNGVVIYTSEGIDPNTTLEHCILTHINTPAGSGVYMYITTLFFNTRSASSNRMQTAFPYNADGSEYHRYYNKGSWSSWKRITNANEFSSVFFPIGTYRFNKEWIGFYSSYADAKTNENRKGWMGHDSGDILKIYNEVENGHIFLSVKSGGGLQIRENSDSNYDIYITPTRDNQTALGTSSLRWKQIYCGNTSISTSDEREKHNIVAISNLPSNYGEDGKNVLETLFDRLVPKMYCLNDDNEEENSKMRIGYVAQDIAKALSDIGIEESEIGILKHDVWTEKTGEVKDRYGLSYNDFIALNTHMIQKANAKIEHQQNEINELKSQVEKLRQLVTDSLIK